MAHRLSRQATPVIGNVMVVLVRQRASDLPSNNEIEAEAIHKHGLIVNFGSPEQKARWLPDLLAGMRWRPSG